MMSKYLNIINLLQNERRSLDELINFQNIALRKIVKHAYNTVKFYKDLFDDLRLAPNDIKTIEDIHKLPVIDKKTMLKNSYDNLLSANYKLKNLIHVKTSGSNGKPFLFYINYEFDQFRKAQCLRPYITNGKRLFDHTISFGVHKAPPKKWFSMFGIMHETRILSDTEISYQIKTIRNIKPDVIQGYCSILNLLSVKAIEDKIPMPKPRLLFTDSELLKPDMRKNIENAFNTKIIDVYGTWETDNIAYECSHHQGYHITIDSVIMEFLSHSPPTGFPKDEKPVNQNEEGEIVVTILNNYAMPFIRYNLHDIGSFSEKKCSCGRTFPLMNQIKGRDNDYMYTEDGERFSPYKIGMFRSLAPNVTELQIIQEDFNLFTLNIVPSKSYSNHAEKEIVPVIKNFFPKALININVVSSIGRESSWKFKTFISKVKNK